MQSRRLMMIRLTDGVAWSKDGSRRPSRAVCCLLCCRCLCILNTEPRCKNTKNQWHAFYFPNTISLVIKSNLGSSFWPDIQFYWYLVSRLRYILRKMHCRHITCHYFQFLLYTKEHNTQEISLRSRSGADVVCNGVNVTQYTFLIQLPELDIASVTSRAFPKGHLWKEPFSFTTL